MIARGDSLARSSNSSNPLCVDALHGLRGIRVGEATNPGPIDVAPTQWDPGAMILRQESETSESDTESLVGPRSVRPRRRLRLNWAGFGGPRQMRRGWRGCGDSCNVTDQPNAMDADDSSDDSCIGQQETTDVGGDRAVVPRSLGLQV